MKEKDIFGDDIFYPTAEQNGYKYISDGHYCKTLKESNKYYNEFVDNGYFRYKTYRKFKIHGSYDFLLRKTKGHLKSIIIFAMPHYKGSLYKCAKRDLIGIIKDEKLIQLD
jgi:hypothetical protein